MKKKELLSSSKRKLMELAAQLHVRGRSRMSKGQLADAISRLSNPASAENPRRKGNRGSTSIRSDSLRPRRGVPKRHGPLREGIRVRRSWREQQALVLQAKYETEMPSPSRIARPAPKAEDLPLSYGEDRIVLMVRDPYWVHVYWEVTRESLLKARRSLGEEWREAGSVLRVYDITGVDFDGTNSNSFFDIEISGGATNWYVNTQVPNRTYCVEIGLLSRSGTFVALARSNPASTPRDVPSDITDEEWMVPDWEFDKVYALSGGFDVGSGSIELKEMMEKALGGQVSSGAPGSLAVSSPPGKARVRGFWFRLGTELIVYGATEPDAKVTIQGRDIELRPDGTFTVRFDLPDGSQVIPAVAESADGVDRITITPVVEKRTEK
jgi:hypothetical protein